MKLYLQDNNNLIKFNLPSTIEGSMLFSFKLQESNIESSLNIDTVNKEWVLKSNGNVNIIGPNNSILPTITLKDYVCVILRIVDINTPIYLYCLPSVDENQIKYGFSNLNQIVIGKGSNCNIIFNQSKMKDEQAIIKFESNNWYIAPIINSRDDYIYVNNQRIFSTKQLNVGDIIFMDGLKIIWMKNNLIIPMNSKLYSVKGLIAIKDDNMLDNTQYKETTELESNITLYKEDDFYSHTPRIQTLLEEEKIKLEAPPPPIAEESDMPFLLSIGSSFTMVGFMSIYVFNLYDGLVEGRKDFSELIPQMVIVITMIIGTFFIPFFVKKWQKRLLVHKEKKRQKKYSKYLTKKEQELNELKLKQEQIVYNKYIDINKCLDILKNKPRALWNRAIKDEDFLEIRVGLGNRPSMIKVEAPEKHFTLDEDDLFNTAAKLGEKYGVLKNVPITFSLKDNIITSLIIKNDKKIDLINSIILQIVTLHSPSDLKIVVFTEEKNVHDWDYLKYTAYNWSEDYQIRFFASNQEEYKSLSNYLETVFSERKEIISEKSRESDELNKEKYKEFELFNSYYVIITDNMSSIKQFKFIKELIANQYNYGFSMLIVDTLMKNVPSVCKNFLLIEDNSCGMFTDKITDEDIIYFKPEYAGYINMRNVAKNVGNIPVQIAETESQLPTMLPFLEMYNVGKVEQLNVRNRWSMSDPMNSLSVPIGVHINGELFTLDLHEKNDGPHGLIAGSTGSGKSEFIITYILSMALNFDPREVQFVLIDYKGGGLTGAFENRETGISIPHLAGTITNLDTAEMNRSLVSIQSEVRRRQVKFNEAKEKTGESTMDIYKYQRLYREGAIDEPISHLFIISDEFAELKSQQADFMSQLVSISRIGRSLGVHLILATQKPSGVVNDQIWSNSKFKVCLKVQTRADSMELLKRPEAASLKEAGRFYLQVGYDEYFDIGQSAWAGDKYVPQDRIIKKLDDSIVFVDNCGNMIKKSIDTTKKKVKDEDKGDQLTNVVKYLVDVAKNNNYKPKKLWLPPLNNVIYFDELRKRHYISKDKGQFDVLLGEYDAPANQEQGLLWLDMQSYGNLLIYGVPGSGKDNIIFTIIYNLISNNSPEEVNIYIGDFGSETLKILNLIPQVGDVFLIDEFPKIESLYKMINKELSRRKDLYSEYGGNFVDYQKLSGKKDPLIVIALNNFENFVENYPRVGDMFNTLFRDAYKYGIVFIVTVTSNTVIRGKVAQSFNNKICLKLSENNEYRDLLNSARGFVPADNYGRGLVKVDENVILEFQTADVCERDKKVPFIRELASSLEKKYKTKAPRIPILPDTVRVDDVLFELKGLDCVPIGIEKNSLEVYVYDFLAQKINLIAAKGIKNHIYFVYALINQMLQIKGVKIHVIDALSIYRGDYKGVDLYDNSKMLDAFNIIYKNVQNDSKLEETHVYYILGISEFKKKVSEKYSKNFEMLFSQVAKCKNNTFLYFDDSDSYKEIQVEDWYRNNINNTYGIWLGEDVEIQVTLGIMSISSDATSEQFSCIGYPVYQGRYMVIKYVVDGVDKKNEQ